VPAGKNGHSGGIWDGKKEKRERIASGLGQRGKNVPPQHGLMNSVGGCKSRSQVWQAETGQKEDLQIPGVSPE
jgi:hypothetical protein